MTQPLILTPPFVGREREVRVYREMLVHGSLWVMIVTGQGGLGKSALLRHLSDLTPPETVVAKLNFAAPGLRVDALTILQELSGQIESECDPAIIASFQQSLREGREKLSQLEKQMSQSIVVGDSASLQGASLNMGVNAEAMRQQRGQVREMVTAAFYTQLATFRPARLALLFDTCEWISEGDGLEMGRWLMNELLPGMRERLKRARRSSVAVIASRVPPPLTAVERQECVSLGLPMLDQPAVESYLAQLGMQDAALRQRAYDITRGHALCVAIIGDLWLKQGDHPFTMADLPEFRAQFNERALIEYIQERLDKRLVSPFKELTRYGVLLRSFNLPMLQAVFPELLANEQALDTWRAFIAYPYIEFSGNRTNHKHTFHDLLREIQAAEIREQQPALWQKYHERALDYLNQAAPDSPDRYYHMIALDGEQGISDWWEEVVDPQHQGTLYLTGLFQAAFDVALKLPPEQAAHRAYRRGTYRYLRLELDEALEDLAEADTIYKQNGIRWGEANVLQAMGDVQQFRKELEAAMQSYGEALGLFRQVGSRLGEANCYLAQGRVALQREDVQNALVLHDAAHRLYQAIGDRYSQARLLYYRSYVYEAMGDRQHALEDAQTALAEMQKINVPFIATFQRRVDELKKAG